MEVLDSLVFPEVAANEESENGQYPSSLAFPAPLPCRWVSGLQLQCWSPRADPFHPQPLEEGNELSLSSDTFVLILSVSCCLLTGDRWLITQLGTAHYVPVLGLLNHFEILNSLINILWRAQDSDQACFSPGTSGCECREGSAPSGCVLLRTVIRPSPRRSWDSSGLL